MLGRAARVAWGASTAAAVGDPTTRPGRSPRAQSSLRPGPAWWPPQPGPDVCAACQSDRPSRPATSRDAVAAGDGPVLGRAASAPPPGLGAWRLAARDRPCCSRRGLASDAGASRGARACHPPCGVRRRPPAAAHRAGQLAPCRGFARRAAEGVQGALAAPGHERSCGGFVHRPSSRRYPPRAGGGRPRGARARCGADSASWRGGRSPRQPAPLASGSSWPAPTSEGRPGFEHGSPRLGPVPGHAAAPPATRGRSAPAGPLAPAHPPPSAPQGRRPPQSPGAATQARAR